MKSGKKIEFAPYCYLVPSMLIFAVFLFYPFFKTIQLNNNYRYSDNSGSDT